MANDIAKELSNHTNTLIALLSFFAAVVGVGVGAFIMDFRARLIKVEKRQEVLREETLPAEYVHVSTLSRMEKMFAEIIAEIRQFIRQCHEGNCVMQRLQREAIRTHKREGG